MRCPACAALEPDDAAWCSQCHTRFGDPPAAAPDPGAPDPGAPDPGAPDLGAVDPGVRVADRGVRVIDDEVEWRCARCAGWTPLAARGCARCGAPRHGFGDVPGPPVAAPERVRALQLVSVPFPGLGHLLAGRRVTGAIRLALALGWTFVAVRLVVGTGIGVGVAPAVVLAAGVAVLGVATVVDTGRLHVPGAHEVLSPRRLVWFAIGVVAAAVAAAAAAASG